MTQNQIAYWSLQEQKRTNLAKEQETHRANVKQEELKSDIQESQKKLMGSQTFKEVTSGIKNITGSIRDVAGITSTLLGGS